MGHFYWPRAICFVVQCPPVARPVRSMTVVTSQSHVGANTRAERWCSPPSKHTYPFHPVLHDFLGTALCLVQACAIRIDSRTEPSVHNTITGILSLSRSLHLGRNEEKSIRQHSSWNHVNFAVALHTEDRDGYLKGSHHHTFYVMGNKAKKGDIAFNLTWAPFWRNEHGNVYSGLLQHNVIYRRCTVLVQVVVMKYSKGVY